MVTGPVVVDDTPAVTLETVQGEVGIIVPPAGYGREVKEVCEKVFNDKLMLCIFHQLFI